MSKNTGDFHKLQLLENYCFLLFKSLSYPLAQNMFFVYLGYMICKDMPTHTPYLHIAKSINFITHFHYLSIFFLNERKANYLK